MDYILLQGAVPSEIGGQRLSNFPLVPISGCTIQDNNQIQDNLIISKNYCKSRAPVLAVTNSHKYSSQSLSMHVEITDPQQ